MNTRIDRAQKDALRAECAAVMAAHPEMNKMDVFLEARQKFPWAMGLKVNPSATNRYVPKRGEAVVPVQKPNEVTAAVIGDEPRQPQWQCCPRCGLNFSTLQRVLEKLERLGQ